MPELPFSDTQRRPEPRRRQRGFTLIELLVVIAIIAVLMALLLPAVQQAREAAMRAQCKNNLMQIALALHNYEMAYLCLPPGSIDLNRPIRSEAAGYHFGWTVQLLPFLDQSPTYERFNFSVGLYDGPNSEPRAAPMSVLKCPSNRFTTGSSISYAACHHDSESPIDVDNNGVMFLNSCIRYRDVRDGVSNTIYVGEQTGPTDGLGWASGTRATIRNTGSINSNGARPVPPPFAGPEADNVLAVGGFGSPHLAGAHVAMGDGSIRFINQSISLTTFKNLGNRADGSLPVEF